MSLNMIREKVLSALTEIAPEVDPVSLNPDLPIRDQVDFDSVDLLNFVVALEEMFEVTVPERDYPQIATIGGMVEYLASRAGTTT